MATLAQYASNGESLSGRGAYAAPPPRALGAYTYSSPNGQSPQGQANVDAANAAADAPLGAQQTSIMQFPAGTKLGDLRAVYDMQHAAPAPGVQTPAAPNYADEYQKALAASSAGIANQFHMALSDIAQREGLANQAVGQLPGQLNQVYDASTGNMMQGAASLDAAQKASGLNSYMGAGAQMAPLSAAMGENKTTAMSGVPLLALAVKTQMANERAALEQSHQSALAQLASQNLGNLSDQAKTANAQKYQTDQTNQQHQWDVQGQRNQMAQQLTLAQIANDARVEPKTNMTLGEVNAVRQSPQYRNAVALINGGLGTGTGYKNAGLKDIQQRYAGTPNLMKVIALDFPDLK